MITECCSADFIEDTDHCSDCGNRAIELEDDADCCVSSTNGFPCTCAKGSWAYRQQAEDDGQADHDRDQAQDREWEENRKD